MYNKYFIVFFVKKVYVCDIKNILKINVYFLYITIEMTTNRFIQNPVKVIIFDPIRNINRRTFVILGDINKNIYNAVISFDDSKGAQRQTYERILKEFYGVNFKDKLSLGVDDIEHSYTYIPGKSDIMGGDDTDNVQSDILNYEKKCAMKTFKDPPTDKNSLKLGSADFDDIDFSDIEELLEEKQQPDTQKLRPLTSFTSQEELRAEFSSGVEFIKDIHVYPEDKFSELKEKIYLFTNIPTYRQHIYYIDRNRLNTTYKLYAEGLYNIDIRKINKFSDTVLGIPIDKFLYDIREEIRVEALDTFKILENSLTFNNTIYVVDLAQFTYRIHSQLIDIIRDTYQFELFYYGFVTKYWPQLTKECFYDYMINEPELQHKYPDLAKSKIFLSSLYKTEKEIVDKNYSSINRIINWAKNANISIAITQMTATVIANKGLINIRNLFDKLRVTRCIPEIHAYIEYNNKRFLLRKRHIRNGGDIVFPSGPGMRNGLTLAISLRKSDQDSFHRKTTISTMENEQSRYLFLNIWPNGKYFIRTVWNEEDELGFDDIIKIMKRFTDPIISGINNLGKYVFPTGDLLPLISRQNINYQSLNICIFWKKILLESAFKIIKSLWEPYMKAGITGPRNVQQFNVYEFLFRKGMYDYDINAIERIISASNQIILNNYYAYLSNNAIKQKWDQNYEGRIVRMSHRTTDVKFEVLNIHEQEFQLFYQYILVFISRAMCDEKVRNITSIKPLKDVKKLKKLREQDPELYNLKKYGSKKVYSILCQNQRQPLIYTTEEIKSLSNVEIKKLTKYWNFTLNKEAFYGCPNRKYPHLSFIVNVHPKHYCLPCCKKSLSTEESKKTRVNTVCLRDHKFTIAEGAETASSRHIMNYGKDIDIGRISKLPNTSIKGLFYNSLTTEKLNYYLFGVAQHFPAIKNVGIIYAIAEAMGISAGELMQKVVADMSKIKDANLFNTLLNGTLIEYFDSIQTLILTISEIFVNLKFVSLDLQRFKQWAELFLELFHILYKVTIFTFIDETGKGDAVDLYIPNNIRSEILYVKKLTEINDSKDLLTQVLTSQKYVLVIRKHNKYYPIFAMDSDNYFKTFNIDMRTFTHNDNVIKTLHSMITFESKSNSSRIDQIHDLVLLKEFASRMNYKILGKYVNKQNLCYAILMEPLADKVAFEKSKKLIYVPIDYSVHIPDKICLKFEAFDRTHQNHSKALNPCHRQTKK